MAETKNSKICVACKEDKDFSLYHSLTRRSGKKSVQSKCKECMSIYKKQRYWANHEVELAKMTKSRLKPENVQQRKGYYKKNKAEYQKRHHKLMSDEEKRKKRRERGRQYEKENAKIIAEKKKIHSQKPDVKERKRKIHLVRKETDIQYNIKRRLRFRLRHIVKYLGDKKYKLKSAIDLLGCDMKFFNSYIESKFTDGMCWERLSEIDIDHIKPCIKFDLTKLEEQKKCFHWSNLQPLWHLDNLIKGQTYEEKAA